MVDPVQQRDHGRVTDLLGRGQLERRLQPGRLDGHPQDVDVAIEHRCSRHVDLERSERRALDDEPPVVAFARTRPEQQNDVGPGPAERRADEAADPAGAEHRVAKLRHAGEPSPTRPPAARDGAPQQHHRRPGAS